MQGKTVIITGANTGLGKASSMALAEQGAQVVMVCRSPERGAAAQAEIIEGSGNPHVDLVLADLAFQDQVRAAAAEILRTYPRIDVLMNNAGIMKMTRHVTPEGIELQLAVNHLAPFLLTNLLIDHLRATAAKVGEARIVNVSSSAHRGASIPFRDLQNKRFYIGFAVYGQTKLMNILHVRELARRLEGSGVTANAAHPGAVYTDLYRFSPDIINDLFGSLIRTPQNGAETQVHLAASPEVSGVTGRYFADCAITTPSRNARNDVFARRLWQASAALTAER